MPVTINGSSGITSPAIDLTTTPLAVADGGTGLTAGENMFRNRIINGDMRIDQRNAGAAISVSANQYPLDRFYVSANASGVISAQRSSVAPAGFTNSLGLTVTTPRTSIAATDVYGIRQAVEGFNFADFGFGTANAQAVTLSFWVRSSITGTYAVAFWNSSFNRNYVATYTINSANTWEQKTVTITGDTSGTWETGNGQGITVYWDLGSGSNYNGTSGSWLAYGAIRTSSTANWISTNGATFYITGVQLEKGSTATSFDYRPYGTELMLCQRYYYNHVKGNGVTFSLGTYYSSTYISSYVQFPVTMRAIPSGVIASGTDYYAFYRNSATDLVNALTYAGGSTQGGELYNNSDASGTAGQSGFLYSNNNSSSIAFSAEL